MKLDIYDESFLKLSKEGKQFLNKGYLIKRVEDNKSLNFFKKVILN